MALSADADSKKQERLLNSGVRLFRITVPVQVSNMNNTITVNARKTVRRSIVRLLIITLLSPRKDADNAAMTTANVVVFIPPAAEPGAAPISINTISNIWHGPDKLPGSTVEYPVVLPETDR